MFGTAIDLELAIDRATEAIVRDHSLNSAFDQKLRTTGATLAKSFGFVSTNESRKAHVGFLSLFLATDLDVGCIDDYDKITGVHMGGVDGLVLPTKQVGGLHGNMA